MGSPSPLQDPFSCFFLSHIPFHFFCLPADLADLPAPLHPVLPGSHRMALGHRRCLPRNSPQPPMAPLWPKSRIPRHAGPLRLSLKRYLVSHPSDGSQRRLPSGGISFSPRPNYGRPTQLSIPTIDSPNHRNFPSSYPILSHTPSPRRRHLLCCLSCLETPFPTLRLTRPTHLPRATISLDPLLHPTPSSLHPTDSRKLSLSSLDSPLPYLIVPKRGKLGWPLPCSPRWPNPTPRNSCRMDRQKDNKKTFLIFHKCPFINIIHIVEIARPTIFTFLVI